MRDPYKVKNNVVLWQIYCKSKVVATFIFLIYKFIYKFIYYFKYINFYILKYVKAKL